MADPFLPDIFGERVTLPGGNHADCLLPEPAQESVDLNDPALLHEQEGDVQTPVPGSEP